MGQNQFTPSDVVAANVRVYMRWRGLTQKDLAERMTLIGMGLQTKVGTRTEWHQRTIGQILTGQRRIDVDELFGLATALEVTVGALLSPLIDEVANFDAEYHIGDLEPLGFQDFEILLKDLAIGESRPRLVLAGWPIDDDSRNMPKWLKQLDAFEQKWSDAKAEFAVKHPEIDMNTASALEILAIIEEDNKGDGIKD